MSELDTTISHIEGEVEAVYAAINSAPNTIFLTTYGVVSKPGENGVNTVEPALLQELSFASLTYFINAVRQRQGDMQTTAHERKTNTTIQPYRPKVFVSSGHPVDGYPYIQEEDIYVRLLSELGICDVYSAGQLGIHSAWDTHSEIVGLEKWLQRAVTAHDVLTITSAPHFETVFETIRHRNMSYPGGTIRVVSIEGILNTLTDGKVAELLNDIEAIPKIKETLVGLEHSEQVKRKLMRLTKLYGDKSGLTLSAIAFALQLFNAKELALRATRRTRR